ncbi:MAG: hypothetical protein ACREMG_05065, partial [Gemmatimonadales bacterium]
MILVVAVALIALSVAFAVLFLGAVAPGRQSALGARLAEFEGVDPQVAETNRKRRRQLQAEKLAALVQALGERVET